MTLSIRILGTMFIEHEPEIIVAVKNYIGSKHFAVMYHHDHCHN